MTPNESLIIELFNHTLLPDLAIRQESEQKILSFSKEADFWTSCVTIITSPGPINIKIAISVFLKNLISRSWENNPDSQIRQFFRSNMIKILASCEYPIQKQLIMSLRILIQNELPDWPDLLESIIELLKEGERSFRESEYPKNSLHKVYTSILCALEITRHYKYQKGHLKQEIDIIISRIFPLLLLIGQNLINKPAEGDRVTLELRAETLKLIFKCYKFVTFYDIPFYFRQPENLKAWGQFHCQFIAMDVSSYVWVELNEYEKDQLQISKALKWSFSNLNRNILRYAKVEKKADKEKIKIIFTHDFLPYLLQVLLDILRQFCSGDRWLNRSAIYYIIEIFKNCLNMKHLWLHMKPVLPQILEHFLYPLLILDDIQIDTFNNDPSEYIQLSLAIFDNKNPEFAVTEFIKAIVEKRKKLDMVLQFCHDSLYPLMQDESDSFVSAKHKEALIRIIGSVSIEMLNNQTNKNYDHVEDILVKLVLPNLKSRHEFLVARTFEVISKFSDLQFKEQSNLHLIIYEIITNFSQQKNLVVSLEIALCIQSYLHIEDFKESLGQVILPVISKLLEISNQVDNDTISVVMQECVENFGEQLQPFGPELICKLRDNFMRIIDEVEDEEEKVVVGIGILNTIITVLLSFENNKAIIDQLTRILLPLVNHILVSQNENFISEIGEIAENLVYLNKSTTLELLNVLNNINDLFNNDIGVLYFEDLLPCLKNYLIYRNTLEQFNEIFLNIFTKLNKRMDYVNDLVLNFELIQYFILMLKLDSVKYFPFLLEVILPHMKLFVTGKLSNIESPTLFKISLLNVVTSMIIYDSNWVVFSLGETFNVYLDCLFKQIPRLARTYDIKLTILGLISIINNNKLQITLEFSEKLIYLLKRLPQAIHELNNRRRSFNLENIDDIYNFSSESGSGIQYEAESDEDIINDDHNQYLNFLDQEHFKLNDEIIEDPMEVTPLDNTNLKEILTNFLHLLKINNNSKFNSLFGTFTDEELKGFVNI